MLFYFIAAVRTCATKYSTITLQRKYVGGDMLICHGNRQFGLRNNNVMFTCALVHDSSWRILKCLTFFIFGRKRKCRRKWNSIYGRKRNEIVLGHLFSAEKRKSPDNISFFSYIQSPSTAPPIPRPASPFLQLVLVDGIPLSSCTVYRYLCGIFVDDISIQSVNSLLSWFIAIEWKQFSTIYALCFTGVCVA